MTDDWRTPEKRQMIVRKIAETVQQYPDVLNRNPSEIEEAIFAKVTDKDAYMNMVGKVLLSIKHKGHQLISNRGGGGPGGMMPPYQPGGGGGMHPNEAAAAGYHPGMPHMRPGGMPHHMGPGMSGGPPPPHMMNAGPGYAPHRMPGMHPGGPMIPAGMTGGPPMMGMGPGGHPRGVPPGMMYPGGGGMLPPRGGSMQPVHRMPSNAPPTMNNPTQPTNAQQQQPPQPSDGVQPVTTLPNPSFGTPNTAIDQHSTTTHQSGMNPPPPNFSSSNTAPPPSSVQQQPTSQYTAGMINPPHQQQQQQSAPTHQAPSPAPPKSVNVPSPRPVLPMPSPGTPWPNSPAHAVPSPSQSHPEANSAVLSKLQELQPYVPLLARMMDRIEKSNPGEKTKNEQWVKLNSLYNVIQSKNIKVPLQTLEKCHAALVSLFKNQNAPGPSPAPNIAAPTSGGPPVSNPSVRAPNNPPSVKVPAPLSPPPSVKPPIPSSPPVSSPSRNLHDFVYLSSPHPLSSALQPTFCPDEDPLERLPPEKKAKLDEQANRSFMLCLRREILRLRNFHIKQIQQHSEMKERDGSIMLECKLISEGLPSVPPILVRVSKNYPNTSPECLIPEYQSDSSATDFNKKVGHALMNQLSHCEFNYTVSHILDMWEDSVLEVVSRELEDVSE